MQTTVDCHGNVLSLWNLKVVLSDVRICQHMWGFWKISLHSAEICADFNICAELCGFSIKKSQFLVISTQIFISKEIFISMLNSWTDSIPTSYMSLCRIVEEVTMWQVGSSTMEFLMDC